MHFLLFILAFLSLATLTSSFEIRDCAAGKQVDAKLISLNINTCPEAKGDRCDFIKGKNETMMMDFEPTSVFTEANIKIFGKIGPMYIPFHLDGPSNACGNYGFDCPVQVGHRNSLTLSLPVKRTYPTIKTIVRFEMNDEKKNPIICFEFPVQLKNEQSRGLR